MALKMISKIESKDLIPCPTFGFSSALPGCIPV